MKKEFEYSFNKLNEAYNKLNEGLNEAKDQLHKDGVIQRFEFTFELLWKTLKIFLEDQGIICRSPKECLQQAFKYGLISDEKIFLGMLDDRNKTSHIYDQSTSDEIFENIRKEYAQAIHSVIEKLKA